MAIGLTPQLELRVYGMVYGRDARSVPRRLLAQPLNPSAILIHRDAIRLLANTGRSGAGGGKPSCCRTESLLFSTEGRTQSTHLAATHRRALFRHGHRRILVRRRTM